MVQKPGLVVPAIVKEKRQRESLDAYLENAFTYRPPKAGQADLYVQIRKAGLRAAQGVIRGKIDPLLRFTLYVEDVCPDGEECTQAILRCVSAQNAMTNNDGRPAILCIREAVMWANAAIACHKEEE